MGDEGDGVAKLSAVNPQLFSTTFAVFGKDKVLFDKGRSRRTDSATYNIHIKSAKTGGVGKIPENSHTVERRTDLIASVKFARSDR